MRVGKKLAPTRADLKKIKAMVLGGATPEGISEVMRIHLPACQNWHKTYSEEAEKEGIDPGSTEGKLAAQALNQGGRVTGPKKGMPPGIGLEE